MQRSETNEQNLPGATAEDGVGQGDRAAPRLCQLRQSKPPGTVLTMNWSHYLAGGAVALLLLAYRLQGVLFRRDTLRDEKPESADR